MDIGPLNEEEYKHWLIEREYHKRKSIRNRIRCFIEWMIKTDYEIERERMERETMPIPYTQKQIDEIHYRSFSQRLLRAVVWFIDRLNGEHKSKNEPKSKHTAEQMATFEELFEGYEEENSHPDWKLACAMDRYFENKIKATNKDTD